MYTTKMKERIATASPLGSACASVSICFFHPAFEHDRPQGANPFIMYAVHGGASFVGFCYVSSTVYFKHII
jgi:hypothetical protein